MTCEDIDELRSEVTVLRRRLTDLESKVNRCMWGGPTKPEGIAVYPYVAGVEEIKAHFKQWHDQHLEQLLREHIEREIKEVDNCHQREVCRDDPYDMVKYWRGMRVGYTNIRCWLDIRG